jgi:hypothetical protein
MLTVEPFMLSRPQFSENLLLLTISVEEPRSA